MRDCTASLRLRTAVPSWPGRYASCSRCWHPAGWRVGWQCSASSLVLLASRIQDPDSQGSQIIFWLPRRCCRIGNVFSPSLSSVSPNPQTIQHIPSRLVAAGTSSLPHTGSTDYLLLLSARSRSHALPRPAVTRPTLLSRLHQALPKPAGKRKFICTSQLYIPGSLGSSRLGPPNSSQTVSVSSPQSRSSSSASPALSLSLSLSICLPTQVTPSLSPIRIRLRFWCLLFHLSCVSIAWR